MAKDTELTRKLGMARRVISVDGKPIIRTIYRTVYDPVLAASRVGIAGFLFNDNLLMELWAEPVGDQLLVKRIVRRISDGVLDVARPETDIPEDTPLELFPGVWLHPKSVSIADDEGEIQSWDIQPEHREMLLRLALVAHTSPKAMKTLNQGNPMGKEFEPKRPAKTPED